VSPATDTPADRSEEKEEQADGEHHDADRPDDRDRGEQADYEQNQTEDDHDASCPAVRLTVAADCGQEAPYRRISGEGAGTSVDVMMGRKVWAAS
jgi:hypothetical protein